MRGTADFSRNNLDCLRLILASIVVLFHTYELTNFATFSTFDRYLSLNFAAR
jgi:peptidoglycan/LPS O-acetylase OafA/YrhL